MDTLKVIAIQLSYYNGQGIYMLLFLAALLYLWITEKEKSKRTVLVYLTTALGVLFVCPVFGWFAMHFFMTDIVIYYRVFWYLPVAVTVCYASVKLIMSMKTTMRKLIVGLAIVLAVCINGKFVYKQTFHIKAQNLFHIPQNAIDVAQIVQMDHYWPRAVFPAELLSFIRQYTAEIYMPYGRNMVEDQWNFSSDLFDAMEAKVYDTERIASLARHNNCAIVVLNNEKDQDGTMEEQDYLLMGKTKDYTVYMDRDYYEVYKEQGLLDDGMDLENTN